MPVGIIVGYNRTHSKMSETHKYSSDNAGSLVLSMAMTSSIISLCQHCCWTNTVVGHSCSISSSNATSVTLGRERHSSKQQLCRVS